VKVVVFGASGMVGQGVVRECLLDPGVERVLSVVRRPGARTGEKLVEIVHEDFEDFAPLTDRFSGLDACFFCLGVSSAGMDPAGYRRVTHGFALAAARALVAASPAMTFVYVSGAGTDGRAAWAKVKRRTEEDLAALGFRRAFMFRPGYIQPAHGEVSRTAWTRRMYAVAAPLYPVWKRLLPRWVTTTEEVARAMLRVAREGFERPILENGDIVRMGQPTAAA
jgi:uncharacterized protein YbjT (DUF2867 family)